MRHIIQVTSRKGPIDPMLAAIISEIHKTAEKPAKGFMTKNEWADKWGIHRSQASRYVQRALKTGMMVMQSYRVMLKGRITKVKHFGPPSRKAS